VWEDTVGEDGPVPVRLGLREKVSEDKFCNAILLDALQTKTHTHTHTHTGEGDQMGIVLERRERREE
jgi:hypothetical protein